jgi:hypothetical protein
MLPRVREFYGLERLWESATAEPVAAAAPRAAPRRRKKTS